MVMLIPILLIDTANAASASSLLPYCGWTEGFKDVTCRSPQTTECVFGDCECRTTDVDSYEGECRYCNVGRGKMLWRDGDFVEVPPAENTVSFLGVNVDTLAFPEMFI